MSTGCYSDAYTTTSYDFGTATLEVRWSPSCQTNWARLVASGDGCLVGGTLSAVQDTGYTQSTSVGNTRWSNDVFWTAIIYSPVHQVRARHADWQGNTYLTAWS